MRIVLGGLQSQMKLGDAAETVFETREVRALPKVGATRHPWREFPEMALMSDKGHAVEGG